MSNDNATYFMGDDENPPELIFSEDREEAIKQAWRIGVLHGRDQEVKAQLARIERHQKYLELSTEGE